jgi:hypothetical protein
MGYAGSITVSVLTTRSSNLGAEIASRLTSVRSDASQILIDTPLLYPSGAHVVVSIDGNGNSYFVSDTGGASLEADLMGVSRSFPVFAKRLADQTQISFDSNCFYASSVSRDQLVVAVIALANASKQACDHAAFKLASRPYQFDDTELVERLTAIFGAPKVHQKAEFAGASNKIWKFAAAVEADGRQTVFDLVKPSWQSLYPAVVKFTDLSDLPSSPRRVAVLADRTHTTALDLNLLGRSAQIIDFSARDETYRRAA